jgi:transcription antitermination factor NusG
MNFWAKQTGVTLMATFKGRTMNHGPAEIEPVPIARHWLEHKWFVACITRKRCSPNQTRPDILAHQACQDLGIPSWYAIGREHLPGPRARMVDGRKVRMVNRLVFPGYLFVAHQPGFARILDCRFITGMLGYETDTGFQPKQVPAVVMQALFAGQDLRDAPLKEGESVEVLNGPFAQFDGPITKVINANRIEIVLNLLGSERPVEISVDNLKRL